MFSRFKVYLHTYYSFAIYTIPENISQIIKVKSCWQIHDWCNSIKLHGDETHFPFLYLSDSNS